MANRRRPGIEQFWEEADRVGSGQHPLQRELDDRIDALTRCERAISFQYANGRDDAAQLMEREYDREADVVRTLRLALTD